MSTNDDASVMPTFSRASLSRRRLLYGTAAGVGAGMLTATGLERASAAAVGAAARGVTTLNVWYPYGGTSLPLWLKVFNAFNGVNPSIKITPTFAANDLSTNQKLFAAVAAGVPPDVTWVDGPEVSGWGFRGILQPLDKYFAQDNLQAKDFWPPTWKEIQYNSHIYGIPVTADPNFGFFWNKVLFNKMGIKSAPTTFSDFSRLVNEMTLVKNGRVVQIGLLPWGVYGYANSMVTWGWMFGGNFYDDSKSKVTANDPPIVAALEWMVSYAKKFGITNFASFLAPFMSNGSAQLGMVFGLGKMAMSPMGPWEIPVIKQMNPHLSYGITTLPKYGNLAPSSWVGGWCAGIPKGAKNPDASWQFLKWLCATDQGTNMLGQTVIDFPGYKASSYFDHMDPSLKPFYPILESTLHQRPVTPAEDYYMGQLTTQVGYALYGQKTAKQALNDCTTIVQAYINKEILKK